MKNWNSIIRNHLDENRETRKEVEPEVFHPSWLGKCDRQVYVSKAGMSLVDMGGMGSMQVGTLIHEWIENGVNTPQTEDLEFEQDVEKSFMHEGDKVTLTGRYDCRGPEAIYDFKTTAGMNYVQNSPKDAHVDQITCYMAMTGMEKAKLVYISKSKVTDIVEHTVEFDEDRFKSILGKAVRVKKQFKENLEADSLNQVPFEKCGCWLCNKEQLRSPEDD